METGTQNLGEVFRRKKLGVLFNIPNVKLKGKDLKSLWGRMVKKAAKRREDQN